MRKIKLYLRKLTASSFIKNIGILVGGTAFSQLISILVLPILTRIYLPSDFSVLAVYTSIVALISVISCLRFEIAIPIPKKDEDALVLLIISLASVFIISIISVICIILFNNLINQLTQNKLQGFLWLIPLGIFLTGLYTALQYWATRKKAFSLVAKTRMTQSVCGNTAQLGLGYISVAPLGLLIGNLLKSGTGVFKLSKYIIKNNSNLLKEINLNRIKKIFKDYSRFPKYSTWEAFTNSGAIQIPIILIAYFAIGSEAGFLMLAMSLLSAPMSLIGGAVAQVYLSEAAEKYHEGKLKDFTHKTIWSLLKLGFPPLLITAISAPFLVPLVFGLEWQRTGVLITWMAPWFLMQFITSPVSMTLHITNNQQTAMLLQMFGFLLRTGCVITSGLFAPSIIAEVFAITGAIFYSLYLITVLATLHKSSKYSNI